MWMPGNPSSFAFEPGMEEALTLFKAKQIYRIVSVIQPPFMMWNETKRKFAKANQIYLNILRVHFMHPFYGCRKLTLQLLENCLR